MGDGQRDRKKKRSALDRGNCRGKAGRVLLHSYSTRFTRDIRLSSIKTLASGHGTARDCRHLDIILFPRPSPIIISLIFHYYLNNVKTNVTRTVRNVKNNRR